MLKGTISPIFETKNKHKHIEANDQINKLNMYKDINGHRKGKHIKATVLQNILKQIISYIFFKISLQI